MMPYGEREQGQVYYVGDKYELRKGSCRAGDYGLLSWAGTGLLSRQAYQSLLGPDERPVLTIHLVIQATGVAQVVTGPVPPPQWSSCCSTVHTLSGLW